MPDLQLEMTQSAIDFELGSDSTETILKMDPKQMLFAYLRSLNFVDWLSSDIIQTYNIKSTQNSFHFQQKLLLADIDHGPLQTFLKNYIEKHVEIRVKYLHLKYEKQIEQIKDQLKKGGQFISHEERKGQQQSQLIFLATKLQKETIDDKISKLKRFNKQTLIFPLDDYLLKCKLLEHETLPFVKGLLDNYSKNIENFVYKSLKRFGLRNDLIIHSIRPMNKEETSQDIKCKIKRGIIFDITGYLQCFNKFYQAVDRWLGILNWMTIEAEKIQCCKVEAISEWMLKHKNIKAVYLSEHKYKKEDHQRIAVFAPQKDKNLLEKQLITATRIITGKQFQNQKFDLVSRYVRDFKTFVASQKGIWSNVRVFERFILVDCDPWTEQLFRRSVSEFLHSYLEQEVQITEFKTPFHIAIFSEFYAEMIRSKPISLYMINQKLYRLNSKKMSEEAQTQIKDLYKLMRKELVFKPLARPLPQKNVYFEVTNANPAWMTPECLESSLYKLTQKIDICVRSYGSIVNSDSDCIFIIQDLKNCRQLQEILKEEEQQISQRFEEKLKKNPTITKPLRYSKYFQNMTMWYLSPELFQKRRTTFAEKRLKMDIQNILSTSGNMMHINIMIPTRSEQSLEALLVPILDYLVNTCNFNGGHKKTLTLYTSCIEGNILRKKIDDLLRTYNRQNKVQRVSRLDLRLEDIEKIVQYKYIELKYFEDQKTKTASPVNSYIFSRELKKGKTPIFLPLDSELNYSEYIISLALQEIFVLDYRKGTLKKLPKKYSTFPQLCSLVKVVSKIFPFLDYLVVYGIIQKGIFSSRLVFAQNNEKMHKMFQELELQIEQQKILKKNNDRLLKYQLVKNEFLELYKVETHPKKIPHLLQLKKEHFLA